MSSTPEIYRRQKFMKIEIVDPSSLRLHPLLQQLPPADSELLTSIALDIEDCGVQTPLIVDEKGRVLDVDGRDKLTVAAQIDLAQVPIVRASSAEAATILVRSLLQRRHYSKSALAYLAFPFFEPMLTEARERQMRFLKQGDSRSTQNVLREKTSEGLARQAGVSRALFFQAAEVHKLFRKHPAAKAQLEPQILSGDLCLGYAINGVAGILSTRGKARGADDQLELFTRGINTLRIRFAKWDAIPANKRMFVANEFAEAIAEAPEEIRDRILAKLHASRKAAAR
jgi:hypothetical protein